MVSISLSWSAILSEAMKDRTSGEMVKAYQKLLKKTPIGRHDAKEACPGQLNVIRVQGSSKNERHGV